MRRKFAVMDDLGTDLILLCSNCSPASSGERAQLLDDLHELDDLGNANGKRVAYEATIPAVRGLAGSLLYLVDAANSSLMWADEFLVATDAASPRADLTTIDHVAQTMQNYFGAGVQHIAFATAHVFSTAANAQAAGLEMLTVGPNYYEEIGARFALDPALARRMTALEIRYDRDGD